MRLLVGVLGSNVLGAEVLLGVPAQPERQLGDLLAHALGVRHIHVGLGEELRKEACGDRKSVREV